MATVGQLSERVVSRLPSKAGRDPSRFTDRAKHQYGTSYLIEPVAQWCRRGYHWKRLLARHRKHGVIDNRDGLAAGQSRPAGGFHRLTGLTEQGHQIINITVGLGIVDAQQFHANGVEMLDKTVSVGQQNTVHHLTEHRID